MRLRRTLNGALRVALLFVAGLTVNGLLAAFALWKMANSYDNPSLTDCVAALEQTDDGYTLAEPMRRALKQSGCWAMLLDGRGKVIWQQDKPAQVGNRFTPAQVAGFSRWYLMDYPVRVRAVDDGLLVIASPKGSTWKYLFAAPLPNLLFWPVWALLTLGCNFILALLAAAGGMGRRYRERDAARTEWIAAVSHDVRTPLAMVLGYAGSLENAPELSGEAREQAALIRREGEKLRGLIADLNLTNRLAHSMEPLQARWLLLAALVREAAAEFLNDRQDGVHNIEIELAQPAAQRELRGDPALLARMLANLIGNSMRHNPQGCTVRVSLFQKGAWLCLRVADDGEGYPAERLRKLAGKPAVPVAGHGLGLTIVRQIAAAHRGRIRFANLPEGGASCTVRFGIWQTRRRR